MTKKKQKKKKKRIVHIHNHSIYSIADAACKPKDLAKRAVELGIDTLVLTDHGTIAGVIQMAKVCKEYGLKFIPACEMYEAEDRLHKNADDHKTWNRNRHITMLPVNNEGWGAIQYMLAEAHANGFYHRPRIDMKFIEEHELGKNVIATSGCLASKTSALILDGKIDEAKAEILYRKDLFYGYYLEIQDNGSREQEIVNRALIEISEETGVPLVYAKDVHYVYPEDKDAHHALVTIGRSKGGKKLTVYECEPYIGTNTYHLAGADEVYQWAEDNEIPIEALENTWKIADACNVKIELGKNLMPEYPFCEEGHNPDTYLRKLLYDNLITYIESEAEKGHKLNVKDYIDRIESEYRVIQSKGYPSYFLILWDILLWATDRKKWMSYPANAEWLLEENWDGEDGGELPNAKYQFYPEYLVGPGRGSAAGAMTAYLLDITRLDPIEYGLLFERFLNPYRDSPPDYYLNVA